MAWRWEEDRFDAGDVADPRPVMRLFNGLAGEINGHLDRDNIPTGILTKDELDTQAIRADGNEADYPTVVLPKYQTGGWTTVDTKTVTCDYDGALRVSASVNYEWTVSPTDESNNKVQFRLMINGAQVAVSGFAHHRRIKSSVRLVGFAPVASGSSVIVVQVKTYGALWTHIDDIRNGDMTGYTDNYNSSWEELTARASSITYTFRKR